MMNSKQKLVRGLGLVALAVMVVFPPWQVSYTEGEDQTPRSSPLGYRPLWYRLELDENDSRTSVHQRIDLVRLGFQLAAVLVLTNAGLVLLKDRVPTGRDRRG